MGGRLRHQVEGNPPQRRPVGAENAIRWDYQDFRLRSVGDEDGAMALSFLYLWVPKTSSGPVNSMNGLKLWSVSTRSWR